jgi:glycosyltransferase involved in cell wall biosynthesis
MQRSKVASELIIVDNNSNPELKKSELVCEITKSQQNVRIIQACQQGLTFARIAGFKNSNYNWLVFIDDDNIIGEGYIDELFKLIIQHPKVKCWGAGKIRVKYCTKKISPFLNTLRPLFQERNFDGIRYSCNIKGEEFYPPGSSMCIEKRAFNYYLKLIESGSITLSDRIGKSLNSAGDVQIIYSCIKNGDFVGCAEGLTLTHVISEEKTKFLNLMKLQFSLHSYQIKAFNEIFSNEQIPIKKVTNREILLAVYYYLRVNGFFPLKQTFIRLAEIMGMFNARVIAGDFRPPLCLTFFKLFINIK